MRLFLCSPMRHGRVASAVFIAMISLRIIRDRAHAVLTVKENGNYLVSVRAPMINKQGAADLCMQFPTGGGRAGAAGINDLPAESLDDFVAALGVAYGA